MGERSGVIVGVSAAVSAVSVACCARCAPAHSPAARGGNNPAECLWSRRGGGGDVDGDGYGPFEL